MAENQVHSTTLEKRQSEETCPSCPPYPLKPDYNVPEYKEPEEWSDYNKIPDHVKEEIKAARETARRKANDKLAESIQKADDASKEAKFKLELAKAKYESATKVLCDKNKNAKEELWPVYRKCIRDSSPKNCMDDIPQDKKAICIAVLERDLSVQDIEFQTGMQALEQTKSEADAEWEEAQKAYDSAICLAKAEKEKAYKDADVEWRKNLSQALEEIC